MTLDDILTMWATDAPIQPDELGDAARNIAVLHHRYLRILTTESMRLRILQGEMKVLRKDKEEFLSQGPSEVSESRGWRLPSQGKILRLQRPDLDTHLDADSDIQTLSLKIGMQIEKVDALKSIIEMINRRSFQIRGALDYLKFTQGDIHS